MLLHNSPDGLEREIAEFFASYSAAFGRFDVAALADHLAYPAHIVSDDDRVRLVTLSSEQDYGRMIDPLLAAYRELGVESGGILAMTIARVSSRLANVTLEWEVCSAGLHALYVHTAVYTLARVSERWRIVGILVNELPALKACLSARTR